MKHVSRLCQTFQQMIQFIALGSQQTFLETQYLFIYP